MTTWFIPTKSEDQISHEAIMENSMTENEKLRALLAEARVITQDSLDSNTTGFEAENEVCKCNACERYRSIIARIDAALAEPVVKADPTLTVREACRRRMPLNGTDAQALEHAITITERERDEARAVLSALCAEFDGTVAHADWRADGSKGMHVPFTGDFASAVQLPSVVSRMRWWVREMRKTLGGTR